MPDAGIHQEQDKSYIFTVYNEQNYSNNSTKSVRGATKSPET